MKIVENFVSFPINEPVSIEIYHLQITVLAISIL